MNFLHQFHPDPILLQVSFITIRWYGLIIALALLIAIILASKMAKKYNLKTDDVYELAFWLALGGIIGARLYDVFIIDWWYYGNNLSEILKIWHGGLAIHGAIIGGAMAAAVWSKIKRVDFWLLADLIVPVLALAQSIGRWGNYFNSELFGRPTNRPWGLPIATSNRPVQYQNQEYFQPAFLYESVLDFILFLILLQLYRKGNLDKGQLTGVYLIGYGLIRFFMEFVRVDSTPVVLFLRLPQVVSLALIIFGCGLIFYRRSRKNN